MDKEDPLHCGYLYLPPTGKLLTKKWQQKYCLIYKPSKFGIGRIEIYDNCDIKNSQARIVTLENCIKVSSNNSTTFSITTKKDGVHEFSTNNADELPSWLNAIQSVAFPDDASKISSIEEDNDLYCSSEEGVFSVIIHESPASERCGLVHNESYTLVLTPSSMQLRNSIDNRLLFTWPYCFIRRYGYKNGKFTFEAGRKCESGEGIFFLQSQNQQKIYRCLSSKLKIMKKMLCTEPNNSSILECEPQLLSSMSIEKRSRSPLPPSLTTNLSPLLTKDLSDKPLHFNENNRKFVSTPIKPLRNTTSSSSDKTEYEHVDKYDDIEVRQEAWKTMGVHEINHDEPNHSETEEYMSLCNLKQQVDQICLKAPKIIKQNPKIGFDSYDKLNHFGSSSKINIDAGYKPITLISSSDSTSSPKTYNEYDEVQPLSNEKNVQFPIDDIRPADDSHLGYAKIRKDVTGKKKENPINHHFHNNEPYAIISKQKRV